MKCSKCDKSAEYDAPAMLCGEHWAEWWAYGQAAEGEIQPTPEESAKLYKDAMKIVQKARNKNV